MPLFKGLYYYVFPFIICCTAVLVNAQCPPNIGFEEGSFNKWNCHTGAIDSTGGVNLTSFPAINGRHTLLKKSNKDELDLWKVSCELP